VYQNVRVFAGTATAINEATWYNTLQVKRNAIATVVERAEAEIAKGKKPPRNYERLKVLLPLWDQFVKMSPREALDYLGPNAAKSTWGRAFIVLVERGEQGKSVTKEEAVVIDEVLSSHGSAGQSTGEAQGPGTATVPTLALVAILAVSILGVAWWRSQS